MILEQERKKERRYSPRWPCFKPICFRVRGRRHVYEAHLRERSLNGLVIGAASDGCPAAGTYLVPADANNADRHGFRLGYVCRTSPAENSETALYVEILA